MHAARMAMLSSFLTLGALTIGSLPAVSLEDSGPIAASRDGQIIENVRIDVEGRPAITVNGFSNVIIRNVEILHDDAPGISCSRAPGLIVENVSITHTGADTGSAQENNISCFEANGLRIRNALVTGGSAGIYILNSEQAHLSYIEGHNIRGPDPRGQLVQFNKSPNCVLENFSVKNDPAASRSADNVSVYQSDHCVVRQGFLDGNNGPYSMGVMFEESNDGLLEDVDTVRQGNGSFGAYPGNNVTFRRSRARDNICTDQGRGPPSSNAIVWAGSPDSSGLRIESSVYFNLCNPNNRVWDTSSFDVIEITEEDFTPRPPVVLTFPWQEDDPDPAPDPNPDPDPDPAPDPDVTPPSVQFLMPSDGDRVRRGSRVTIEVAATDESAIRVVRILIDGSQVTQLLGDGPYTYGWQVPTDSRRRVRISAQAEDTAGNASEASISVRLRGR